MSLTRTHTLPVAPSIVYYMLTNENALGYWLADRAYSRPAVGGHILLTWLANGGWHVSGEFTELKENESVAYTWRVAGETKTTTVTYALKAVDGGTSLTFTHEGLSDDEKPAYEDEWDKALKNLVSALTTGADIRITERILIGIFPDNMDEKAAKRLGLPVNEGLLVANTIPNLGAEKAGLKAGDLVVEANGKPVGNNTPLTANLAGLKPGDSALVTFYRGAEKHTVTLTLSGYPLPPMPDNFIALADRSETEYATVDQELRDIFAEISDETANTAPAQGEWSANQVLAHLILTERNTQEYLGGFVQAPEPNMFTGNATARVNAVVKSYKNTQGLLNEFKRAHAESVALLRAFEDEKFDRPYILWWVNFSFNDLAGGHNRQHINQIKQTLATVTK